MNMRFKPLLILFLLIPTMAWGEVDTDGTDDLISLTSNTSIDDLTTYTASLWFKADTYRSADWTCLLCKYVTTGTVLIEVSNVSATNALDTFWATTGANMLSVSSNSVVTTGVWYNVIVTFDNAGDRKGRIYLNGIEVSYASQGAATGSLFSNGANNLEAGRIGIPGRNFDGKISEIAIWNVILTSQEILNLANSRIKRMPLQIRPTALRGYWPLDDSPDGTNFDGDTAKDLSANANNGTGDNGSDNTGLTAVAEEVLSYP